MAHASSASGHIIASRSAIVVKLRRSQKSTVAGRSSPPRSTMTLLYGSGGLAPALEDESASRCFTLDGVRGLVTDRAETAGRSVSFVVNSPEAAGAGFVGDRARLFNDGCALVTDVRSGPDGYALIAVLAQRS